MGRILKWMARRGNVGSTARWAAKFYRAVRKRHPDLSTDKEIFAQMMRYRYELLPNEAKLSFLLEHVERHHTMGLSFLVQGILEVEVGYLDNDPEVQQQFDQVIEEELQKSGLPAQVIFGHRAVYLSEDDAASERN